MIIYNKYTNNQDHNWYDSSNVIYSKCYDNAEETKTLKIVFSNGRTYLYKDVNVNDYIAFRTAESNGKAFNSYIKKYQGVRIADTDIDKLNELKETFINEEKEATETKLSNLIYLIEYNNETGQFILKYNNKPIYNGVEGEVSILNLFKSMNIAYVLENVDELVFETDENDDKIKID